MKKEKSDQNAVAELTQEGLYKENKWLWEENKKLNDKIEHLEFDIEAWKKLKAVWEKKEQKLQIEIGGLMGERDGLKMVVEKLKEENQTLELWLDNKEKLNEEYRKQIDKLKSDLGECECSFGFESDEVGYRKREYKRLKKRIKDHCKGYGNLFPEDEMKRQRKKADKKRKKTKEDDELIYEEGLYD